MGIATIHDLESPVASCLDVPRVVFKPVSGGAANRAFVVFDAGESAGPPLAFLRCAPEDGGLASIGYSLKREAAILEAARDVGLPVAEVLGAFDRPDALLMRVVPGTSRPSAREVDVVGPKYMALVATLHASDVTRFPVRQFATIREAVAADLENWERFARTHDVGHDPLIALATRVLSKRTAVPAGRPAMVHGDVGAGNFMCLDGEVTAMLDWELAHVGDPLEDLAWLWMRGAHTEFGDPRVRIGEYGAAAAGGVDDARLAWHLAFVMWKSVISMRARLRHPSVDGLSLIQHVVRLTYDALLGSQLVRVLGGSLPLLTSTPQRVEEPEACLAAELLTIGSLGVEERIVVEYLRDSAAQMEWERGELRRDCRDRLGIGTAELSTYVTSCPEDRLLDLATVVARRADRRSQAMPKAVRRIQRAQRIGLGTT